MMEAEIEVMPFGDKGGQKPRNPGNHLEPEKKEGDGFCAQSLWKKPDLLMP